MDSSQALGRVSPTERVLKAISAIADEVGEGRRSARWQLQFAGQCAELADPDAWQQWLATLRCTPANTH